MLIAILSDIHSNYVALEAVQEQLPAYDQLWCLGDTIGYGPRPNECLQYVRDLGVHVLTGNHDLASLGSVSLELFNDVARVANEWNGKQLREELCDYLKGRPARLEVEQLGATLAHASPREPVWEYIVDDTIARANWRHFPGSLCLVGHTHVPTICTLTVDGVTHFRRAERGEVLELLPNERYILNPGSVGQPRDGDPRAAYALWDTDARTVRFERIGYDVGATQRQIRDVGLPEWLAERLELGQ